VSELLHKVLYNINCKYKCWDLNNRVSVVSAQYRMLEGCSKFVVLINRFSLGCWHALISSRLVIEAAINKCVHGRVLIYWSRIEALVLVLDHWSWSFVQACQLLVVDWFIKTKTCRTTVLNLFRLADHFLNFVSVRRPPRPSRAKASPGPEIVFQFTPQTFRTTFLVNFTQKIIFFQPNFLLTFF